MYHNRLDYSAKRRKRNVVDDVCSYLQYDVLLVVGCRVLIPALSAVRLQRFLEQYIL